MKKIAVVFLVFSLSMLFAAGTVTAPNAAYPMYIYSGISTPTLDGKWTTGTEWIDAYQPSGLPANLAFRNKYTVNMTGGFKIYEWYIVEFFGDNTNDTGDYVQICYDSNATGSSAPKTADIRVDIVGHNPPTVVTYKGNGTAWVPAAVNDTAVAQSLTSSGLNSSPHWITEFRIEKQVNGLQLNNAIRVAVYDASNPSAGVIAFPPTSQQDVPSGYSLNTAVFTSFIPALRASAFCNVTVLKGWTWNFFVQSLGGYGSHSYQWYEGNTTITGQRSTVMAISKNTAGTYVFRCQVTDEAGQVTNTNNVTMTVLG